VLNVKRVSFKLPASLGDYDHSRRSLYPHSFLQYGLRLKKSLFLAAAGQFFSILALYKKNP
jgi:hypothetical protein